MMVHLGIIGYGARMDMLMDDLLTLPYEVQIKAIADINPERVRALMTKAESPETMHRLNIDKIDGMLRKCPMNPDDIAFYTDADRMLDAEKLDGVLIGTNCDTHAALAQKVLARNIPLFLEKPVATTLADLKSLSACEKASSVPVVVSFPLRVTALVKEVKRLLNDGVIGKVEHVQAFNDVAYGFVYFHDWYRNEAVSHGLFLQKATHDIDVLNYLLDERAVEVCAMKSKQIYKGSMPANLRCSECDQWEECPDSTYNLVHKRGDTPRSDFCGFAVDTGNEDSGSMLVRYESGLHIMYSQNFFARKKAARRGARLYGYKGTLEFNFATNNIHVYDHMSDKVTVIQMPEAVTGHGGGDEVLAGNFVRLILGKDTQSVAPLRAGIDSALTCMLAKQSAEEKKFFNVEL